MTTEKLAFYLRTALAWIDAVPKEVAAALPAMPGFDRDEADAALVGMPSGKMAPVQGYPRGIPWEMHLQAYDVYCKKYGKQEALITGWCRGGFGTRELDDFIPGWREKLTERAQLVARIVELTKEVEERAAAVDRIDEYRKALVETLTPAWNYVQENQNQFGALPGDDKTRIVVDYFLKAAKEPNGPFVTFDDGAKVYIDSWTGGAHELGHFGGITLRFVDPEGKATVRGYQAIDTLPTLIAQTPAAQRRENGEPDPHAGRYDGERATLTLGSLTDDELANGVFMNADQPLNIERTLARDPEYYPPIVWLTAAKERIRWLSRALVKADVNATRFKALRDLCGFVENGTDGVVTIFQDDATREWVVKVDKKGYYGQTMPHALDAAIAGEGDKTNG